MLARMSAAAIVSAQSGSFYHVKRSVPSSRISQCQISAAEAADDVFAIPKASVIAHVEENAAARRRRSFARGNLEARQGVPGSSEAVTPVI
jgi:hypothetical protein